MYIIYSLFIDLIARKLLDIVQGVFWWSEKVQKGVGMIRNYENQQKVIFEGAGEYGIPEIEATNYEECDFISFNYAAGCKSRADKGCHFFIDDYQFQRLWSQPDRYMDMLGDFRYVMSPDFSTYTDFPKALQVYNHFRKHWIGAYMQLHGIDVIPTISWSTPDSFKWCFDGEPAGGVVAVSSVGVMNREKCRELFMLGYNEMLKRLEPETILFYGAVPEECEGNIIRLRSFSETMRERINDGRQRQLERDQ